MNRSSLVSGLYPALLGLMLAGCVGEYPGSTSQDAQPRTVPDYFEPSSPVPAEAAGLPAPQVVRPAVAAPEPAPGGVLNPGQPDEPTTFEDLLPWLVAGEASAWYELDPGSIELAWLDPAGSTRGQWSIPVVEGVATTVVVYDHGHESFAYEDPTDQSATWGVRQIAVDTAFDGSVRPAVRMVEALSPGSSFVVRALAQSRRVHVQSPTLEFSVAVDPGAQRDAPAMVAWVSGDRVVVDEVDVGPRAADHASLRVVDPTGATAWDVYADCLPGSDDPDCERPIVSGASFATGFALVPVGAWGVHVVPHRDRPLGLARLIQVGAGDLVQVTPRPGNAFEWTEITQPSGDGDVPLTVINTSGEDWSIDLETFEAPELSKAPMTGERWQLFAGRSVSLVVSDAAGDVVGQTAALPQPMGIPMSWLLLEASEGFEAHVIRDDVPLVRPDAGYLRMVHASTDAPPLRPVLRGRVFSR